MKIFVTGATGFVGRAVSGELQRRGHHVTGLARSRDSAEKLAKTGIGIHTGDISDPATIVPVLNDVDAVVHTAFDHDFSRYADNCAADGRLLEAVVRHLEGTDKILLATSATVVTGDDTVTTEHDVAVDHVPRSASEAFLEFSHRGVRTNIVRLPPTVHGFGDSAFIPAMIAKARESGLSAYMGDGANRWPAVHRMDAARLFCDAVEQARSGVRYHAVAEPGIAFRTIAEAIGEGLGFPVESLSTERAEDHFGWLAMFAGLDNPTSSDWTRETTGWEPREKSLLEDLETGGYFNPPHH
ncbi:SDR family oxidoreductase [uncultured Algimonas sp.]|uniref:SDR family oxidoreductase n=1 Tax=uncultured Algimonas sp. TaxID=1547920 RepID=UPI002604DAC4|nr:SDR family oxidoreductase [uncultured Algimonas sp.]